MKLMHLTLAAFWQCVIVAGLAIAASPAAAQWTRVLDLPATDVVTVSARGDTMVAGTNSLAYVSLDAGSSWHPTTRSVTGVPSFRALRVLNGRLYAGTGGKGVFVSDDLGGTWRSFNEGLVGGLFDSQLDIADLEFRGDSLYAATLGAGVYVRKLTGVSTWSHFGEEFEPNESSNVNAITVGGTRLIAAAGGNGSVFFRDPGGPDWTISWLNNVSLHPGLQASTAAWTGSGWVIGAGAARGVFRSALGQEPWTFVNLNLGVLSRAPFATRGSRLFAAFVTTTQAVIETSGDDGATWQELDRLPNVFVYRMATGGTDLYAGRVDGLWRRSTSTVSVSGNGERAGLRFALAGPQPIADLVRFHFELPRAAGVSIEVFDVAGRRAAVPLVGPLSAGPHDVSWNAGDLAAGVYHARLATDGIQEVVRLVRVR